MLIGPKVVLGILETGKNFYLAWFEPRILYITVYYLTTHRIIDRKSCCFMFVYSIFVFDKAVTSTW
jgi:hypothetical protein